MVLIDGTLDTEKPLEKQNEKPKRIQYSRQVPLPKNTVYVGRPSPWGNSFKMKTEEDRDMVIRLHRAHLLQVLKRNPSFLDPLKGKDLACWCPLDKKCHADTLLELANR